MVLIAALAVVLGVVVVREVVRGVVQGGPFRSRTSFELVGPGTVRRRIAVIAAGLVATYAAVVAIGIGYAAIYGRPTGEGFYQVKELLPDSAAAGKLQPRDRIEAVDGAPLRVRSTRSLVDRINDKAGAPVELAILRDGARQTVRIEPRRGTNARGEPQWLIGIRPRFEAERTTEGAFGFALAYPWQHTKGLVRSITRSFEGTGDVASVVRIVEELRFDEPAGLLVLLAAQRWASHLLLLAVLLDLLRLALAIRDRLRG